MKKQRRSVLPRLITSKQLAQVQGGAVGDDATKDLRDLVNQIEKNR